MLFRLFLIFVGAGVGGVLRYVIGHAVQQVTRADSATPSMPWGTIVVNVSGCLAMGFLAAFFASTTRVSEDVRLAILVGVLGGYTTFSSFGRETIALFSAGHTGTAVANILVSNTASLLAVVLGMWVCGRIGR